MAFRSNRTGGHNLWACPNARDCSAPRRLTENSEQFVATFPRWSPDGRRIAFVQRVKGKPSILTVDADGANLRVLSTGFDEGFPAWSTDGSAIFFRSNRGGTPQIWRIPADGSSAPTPVTLHGGTESFATVDGKYLLYLPSSDSAQLMRLSLRAGTKTPVPGIPPLREGEWVLAGDSIYYFLRRTTAPYRYRLHRYDFATARARHPHW